MNAISRMNMMLEVPTTDPDNSRRGKLLNILIVGLGALTILLVIVGILALLSGDTEQETVDLVIGSLVMLVALGVIFAINRYGSGNAASWIFLIFYVILVASTDTPQELTTGRSLFAFSMPILIASVILRPYSSFILATLCSVVIAYLANTIDEPPNGAAIAVFFAIALVSWLASRSLEQALADLRVINLELDQRVADRTRELYEALQQVQTESSKNQAILESIADGVVVFDNTSQADTVNPAMIDLFNLTEQQIIGQKLSELVGKTEDATGSSAIRKVREKGAKVPSMRFQRDEKTLSVSLAPVTGTKGEVTGTVAVFRDFSREAELERLKEQFFSMVTHELRTPLNAILGYSDMLKEGVYEALNSQQVDIMARVLSNGKRMLGLVNNLLDQAQMATGELSLRVDDFELKDVIFELDSVMSVLAENKKLGFSTTIEENVPQTLKGDPQRLGQILINLTGNAVKFTEEGEIKVRAFQHDAAHWAVAISDTGQGIPKSKQVDIFEPFKQVDDPITRKQVGSGLGLSIVTQLVELMGGEILLDSEIGKGSTFTLILPYDPPQPTETPTIQEGQNA